MKKILTVFLITGTVVGLMLLSRYHPDIHTANASFGRNDSGSQPSIKYKNGRFTGQAVDVGYGPVQVQAVIRSGKIVDVKFLQMPDDRDRSIEVTNMAEPILRHETLTAQSADIDIASGATQTSEGYIQSLQDALAGAQH